MLKNYIKTAYRNLIRNRFYSFINIAGLTIGISVSLLIAFFVVDELSYDRFHKDADQIYQVYLKAMIQGKPEEGPSTCAPIAAASREELAGVEDAIRLALWRDVVFRTDDNMYTEKKLLLADSNFFHFFTFELLEGDPGKILNNPDQIILTESSAEKYFGYTPGQGDSPIGKSLLMGTEKTNCEVVGIMRNPPQNSHFQFDMVLSMVTWDFSRRTQWTSNSLYTYVKLEDDADPDAVSAAMRKMSDKYVGPEIEMYLGISLQEWRETGAGDYSYQIQPMTDIHLRSVVSGGMEPAGDIAYVYLLSVVSIFLIVIACINFMNLSTARSTSRAKEVGIRKAVGAQRTRLVGQFLMESIIVSTISTLLAVAILLLVLPFFNQISGKNIEFIDVLTPQFFVAIFLIMIGVGSIAGSYPAFYLTAFRPADVLKGRLRQGASAGWIRSTLVVFQFGISVFLIICTLIIYKQLKLVQEKNLGYDRENVLIVENVRTLADSKEAFKKRLQSLSSVRNVSVANFVPPHVYSNSVYFPNGNTDESLLFYQIYVDPDYQKTIGFEMSAGRFFSEDFPSDSTAVVINRKGLEAMGWKTHEGNRLAEPAEDGGMEFYEVIGVVEDFNYSSLKAEIEPLIFFKGDFGNLISVRLESGNMTDRIKDVEEVWNEMAPGEPFDYSFLDQNFEDQFRSERRLGEIFVLFTSLAIFIACLGLFGLAAFMTEQRSKEIGIRKALGASVPGVVLLLSKEFTRLVLISIVIAVPGVIFMMDWWLENFAYKTEIGVWSFALGGFVALVISWLTVGYQSVNAARTNPVNSLRSE